MGPFSGDYGTYFQLYISTSDSISDLSELFPRGVASNEAEEAVASSLFCARTRARIGDII